MSDDIYDPNKNIILTSDDVKTIRSYYDAFGMEICSDFDEALVKFEKEPNLYSQKVIRMHLATDIMNPKNLPFEDPSADKIKEVAMEIASSTSLDIEMEKTLTKDSKED